MYQLRQRVVVAVKVEQHPAAVGGNFRHVFVTVRDLGYGVHQPAQFSQQGIAISGVVVCALGIGNFAEAIGLPVGRALAQFGALDIIEQVRTVRGCKSIGFYVSISFLLKI